MIMLFLIPFIFSPMMWIWNKTVGVFKHLGIAYMISFFYFTVVTCGLIAFQTGTLETLVYTAKGTVDNGSMLIDELVCPSLDSVGLDAV